MNAAFKAVLQGSAIRPVSDEIEKLPLVMVPLVEEVFCGRDGQGQRQHQADPGEAAGRASEDDSTHSTELISHAQINFSLFEVPGPDP
jgi:hypothetical protein